MLHTYRNDTERGRFLVAAVKIDGVALEVTVVLPPAPVAPRTVIVITEGESVR